MKHHTRNWVMIASLQFGILCGSFSLPNSIVNGATWYAPIIDFGRIALLFGFPVGDILILQRSLTIGKRKKAHIRQFISIEDVDDYEEINPLYFANLTIKQTRILEGAFDYDRSLSFQLLQRHLEGTSKNV